MRRSDLEGLRLAALDLLRSHLTSFLRLGELERVRRAIEVAPVPDGCRAQIVVEIELFLRRDLTRMIELGRLEADFEPGVRSWLHSAIATDLHGRLVHAMAAAPWEPAEYERWRSTVIGLAGELLAAPELLSRELEWLAADDAPRMTGSLGFSLGQLDAAAVLVGPLLSQAKQEADRALRSGYVTGLLAQHPAHAPRIHQEIDRLEETHPRVALNLALASRRHTDCLVRALRLIDGGRLPPSTLSAFTLELDGHTIEPADVQAMLVRLTSSAADDQARSTHMHVGLELLGFRVQKHRDERGPSVFTHEGVRTATWSFLAQSASLRHSNDAYHWTQVVLALSQHELECATVLAADALRDDCFGRRDAALEVLSELNRCHPRLVVRELGRVLTEDNGDVYLIGEESKALVAALDPAEVEAWLEQAGVAGARRIAGALPLPSVVNGQAVVPELTRRILDRFGADERTLSEFCRGGHAAELYSGDIAAEHEAQAEAARAFLMDPSPAIRHWAGYEIESNQAHASHWRRQDEEERALE